MPNNISIASPVKGFFEQHLVSQRGLSSHTVLAYRDTMKLFLNFAVLHCRKPCTDLMVDDLDADLVRTFLHHLERIRTAGWQQSAPFSAISQPGILDL